MKIPSDFILDEKGLEKNKRRFVRKHLWRGLLCEKFSTVEQPLFDRSVSWSKKFQVGLFLWLFVYIVTLVRYLFMPRT